MGVISFESLLLYLTSCFIVFISQSSSFPSLLPDRSGPPDVWRPLVTAEQTNWDWWELWDRETILKHINGRGMILLLGSLTGIRSPLMNRNTDVLMTDVKMTCQVELPRNVKICISLMPEISPREFWIYGSFIDCFLFFHIIHSNTADFVSQKKLK